MPQLEALLALKEDLLTHFTKSLVAKESESEAKVFDLADRYNLLVSQHAKLQADFASAQAAALLTLPSSSGAPQTPDLPSLVPETMVRITGLVGRPAMSGCEGYVLYLDQNSMRYAVQLTDENSCHVGVPILVRRENLSLFDDDRDL